MSSKKIRRWPRDGNVEARRTEILRCLATILQDRHISSLKMQDIADRLGITKGNLYYYFKSKRDILFHCHMRYMEGSLRALDQVQNMQGGAGEKLYTLFVLHIRSILEDSYGAVLLSDLETLSARDRREYVALRDKFELGVRRLLEEGVATGEFPGRDVMVMGFATLGGVNWISKWYKPKGPRNSREIAEAFAEFYVAGLRAPIQGEDIPHQAGRSEARLLTHLR